MRRFFNNMKTTMLMAGLMGLCLGIGYLIGGPSAMLPALLIGGVMNIIALFFSDKIALASMRAQPVTAQDDPVLFNMVERLSQKAGLPMPRVFMSPAAAPNAFATGRSPSHSVVCVTAGLRQILNDRELEGVISHELAHIRNRDMLISTMAAIIGGAITYLAYMAMFFGHSRDDDEGGHPIVGLLLMVLAPLAAGIIQMAVSRSREYEADRMGGEICGSPRSLASALQKLAVGNSRIPLPVNDAKSNMFIVQPLTGHGGVAKLFMTHPPIEERVNRLMQMEQEGNYLR